MSLLLTFAGAQVANAEPSEGAYVADQQRFYIEGQPLTEAVGSAQAIVCYLAAMRSDAFIDDGAYVAKYYDGRCDAEGADSTSEAAAATPTSAASETRTFLAEIEVENADGAIPAGISAEVIIPTGEATAHFLSPSIVSLDTQGVLGIKTVNTDNVVEFFPIQVVKAQIDGIWVTGLPETVDVITVGQGYVNEDETVSPSAGEQSQ
jgi:hypothetical protein